ncbi:MAG: histidine phosphatase family protein [Lachnospiraceae bacterium]|nr:histidine phosphatase family protein [Lachnospiraceae bacterium]
MTDRNSKGLSCGRTDALISEEGRAALKDLRDQYEYPTVEKVYSSPAIRCRETASVFFPEQEPEILEGFWEYDFGEYEDTHVTELAKLPMHDKWQNQELDCAFPGGETLLEARFRVQAAMTRLVKDCIDQELSVVAVVAHGEILNLLMSACLITEEPPEAFLLCPNGMGYGAVLDKEGWFEEQKMVFDGYLPEGAERPKAEDSPYFSKELQNE